MATSPLSPLRVTSIRVDGTTLVLTAEGEADDALCPACGDRSRRVHARYARSPLDLPWRGIQVRLALTVRRFRCENEPCHRRTFAEGFGPVVGRRRRFTTVVQAVLREFAAALGGRAGSRLAERQGTPASRATLLRLLCDEPAEPGETPRVLGVDDLALRRGRRYATLLVDMETHEPVDLLEGREAAVLADWLREHPGVEVIVRDRGGAYAEGARQGAPHAKQVADRYHLAHNVSGALDEVIKRRRWATPPPDAPIADPSAADGVPADPSAQGEPPDPAAALALASDAASPPGKPLSPTKQRLAERRAARLARWERVHRLHDQGGSLRGIAHQLGINKGTVKHLLACPAPPHNVVSYPRPGGIRSPKLAPYAAYLQRRWREGCTNGCELYRELAAAGFTGAPKGSAARCC